MRKEMILSMLVQPCFYRAVCGGAITALVSGALKWLAGWEDVTTGQQRGYRWELVQLFPSTDVYNQLMSLVVFSLVFQNGFALSRYNEAAAFLHAFTGNWFDVASSLIAFTRTKEHNARVSEYQHLIARMISMLNALSFAQLGHTLNKVGIDAFTYGIINGNGIDENTRNLIEKSPCKAETGFHMLQALVIEMQNAAVFRAPAPIVSRVLQEMSAGMLKFHEAMRLAKMPLPLHYQLMSKLLIFIFTVYTPLEYTRWAHGPWTTMAYTFIITFFTWFLHGVSKLLEHPFTYGIGVLDMQGVHDVLNKRLLNLLEQIHEPTPCLTEQAILKIADLHSNKQSVQVSKTLEEQDGAESQEIALTNCCPRDTAWQDTWKNTAWKDTALKDTAWQDAPLVAELEILSSDAANFTDFEQLTVSPEVDDVDKQLHTQCVPMFLHTLPMPPAPHVQERPVHATGMADKDCMSQGEWAIQQHDVCRQQVLLEHSNGQQSIVAGSIFQHADTDTLQ